jgi:Spy/CpxP family protein refolding chaperone
MTHRLFSVGAAIAAALVVTSALVVAQGGPGRPSTAPRPGGPGGPSTLLRPGGFSALDLTDEQRAKIAELRKAAREQTAPLREEWMTAQRTLHRDVFAVLTPEQREKMRAMEGRGNRLGRGPGGPGGRGGPGGPGFGRGRGAN